MPRGHVRDVTRRYTHLVTMLVMTPLVTSAATRRPEGFGLVWEERGGGRGVVLIWSVRCAGGWPRV